MWFATECFGSITDLRSGDRWTAARLAAAVRARAAALKARGIGRGDRVALCQSGSGSFFADLFAVWDAGACAICVSPKLTAGEIRNVSAFMQPRLLLRAAGAATDPDAIPSVCLADEERADPVADRAPAASLDDAALVLLTSGTTATPKGVVHSFRSLLARVALNRAVIGDPALRTTLCLLPVHFGHGLIGNCLTPLLAGHDLVIGSELGPTLFGSLDRIVVDHHVTFMSSVPATWRMVQRFCRHAPGPALRRVHVGSAPLSAELWEWIVEWCGTDDVVNAYGLTETANWVAGASARECRPADGLVGRLWGGFAAIRDDDGRLRACGEGEIVLQVPSLMRGYFDRPDLEAQTWSDGWFRTQDLGHIAPDGSIRLIGRRGQEINRGGTKIQPHDLEQVLDAHPDVAETCAFGFADDILGQAVGVAVVFRHADAIIDQVIAWSTSRLSRHEFPDRWYVLDAIPKTDRGKVNRSAVAASCLAGSETASKPVPHHV